MKKGFTLIELLAVIVILAIIATIAVPIVLSIIEDAKESTTLRNAEYYLDAVQQSIAKHSLNTGNAYQPLECEIQEDGNLRCDEEVEVIVEVKGKKPSGGTITFDKGKMNDITLNIETKVVIQNEKGELLLEQEDINKAPTLIGFSLVGWNFQAEDGMTFQEWLDSDYSSEAKELFSSIEIDEEGTFFAYPYGEVYLNGQGSAILGTDVIIADSDYYPL